MNSARLIVGSVIRTAVAALCGLLVHKGLVDSTTITPEVVTEISVGIAGFVFTLMWSLWQKAIAKWKFLEALGLQPVSEDTGAALIEQKAKTSPATVKLAALMKVLAVCALSLGLMTATTSCASLGISSGQTTASSASKNLQLGVVAIHEGLYVPTMKILGAALDAGRITPQQEARIQQWSETYQRLKSEAAGAIAIIDAANFKTQGPIVKEKLQGMLQNIGQLQVAAGGVQ